jgi:membrane protein DedA with SNARE-associated domain
MQYFISIFLGTFILEDVALISSLALIAENKISFQAAFLACFLGISLGDLALYFLGYAASRFGTETKFKFFSKHKDTFEKMKKSQALSYSIVISRFIPGTRLPTYLASGFLKYSFFNFLFLTVASVFVWVLIAFAGGKSLHYLFKDHWLFSLILFIIFLQWIKSIVPKLMDTWQRKAMLYSWRQWLHFEFWPALLFYLPIVPYYIYFSIRYRSFYNPFYASPHLKHGGLIGESKWDLLQHLNPKNLSTLTSLKISKDINAQEIKDILQIKNINYPFILKPDVGQRGFAVRIIRNDSDLMEYLNLNKSEIIIQRLSQLKSEAGVFYVRQPNENKGSIFSITDKKFPFVIGDGVTKLGDLILKDARARIIASVYFSRLQEQLDTVPEQNQIVPLSECGNHCQGAVFLNGKDLISDELTQEIDRIAKQIPDFYFGRFDIRYDTALSLMQGQKFEIVEINGSGAEATHIWDAKTTLIEAYRTLFAQWGMLFEIGHQVKNLPHVKSQVHLGSFFKDCAKVFFRKDSLSVSS